MEKENALVKWIHDNKSSYSKLGDKIGMHRNNLYKIIKFNPEKITYRKAMDIYLATGLQPHEYILGLEVYKNLFIKLKK